MLVRGFFVCLLFLSSVKHGVTTLHSFITLTSSSTFLISWSEIWYLQTLSYDSLMFFEGLVALIQPFKILLNANSNGLNIARYRLMFFMCFFKSN